MTRVILWFHYNTQLSVCQYFSRKNFQRYFRVRGKGFGAATPETDSPQGRLSSGKRDFSLREKLCNYHISSTESRNIPFGFGKKQRLKSGRYNENNPMPCLQEQWVTFRPDFRLEISYGDHASSPLFCFRFPFSFGKTFSPCGVRFRRDLSPSLRRRRPFRRGRLSRARSPPPACGSIRGAPPTSRAWTKVPRRASRYSRLPPRRASH